MERIKAALARARAERETIVSLDPGLVPQATEVSAENKVDQRFPSPSAAKRWSIARAMDILELGEANMKGASPTPSSHGERSCAARSEASVRSRDDPDEKQTYQHSSFPGSARPRGIATTMARLLPAMNRARLTHTSLIVMCIVVAAVFPLAWTPDLRKEPTDESRPQVRPLFAIGQGVSALWQKATLILHDAGLFPGLDGESAQAQAPAVIVERVLEGLVDGVAASESARQTIAAVDCTQVRQLTPSAAVFGDTLRIRVFEEPPVAESERADRGLDMSALAFERLDLSGSYAVDERGELSIPLLGRIDAVGHSLACIEQLVANRYLKAFSNTASVSASFDTRRPVIVSGAVRSPGSYMLTPGMTVRHVLALAGTNAGGVGASSQTVASLTARRLELDHLRVGLNLEISRLQAAMELRTAMDIDPEHRKELDSVLGERRVASELAALESTVSSYQLERERAQVHVDELAERIKLLREQQSVAHAQVDNKRSYLERLKPLNKKGLTPLIQMQSEEQRVMDLDRLGLSISLDLAAAEDAYNVARRELEQSAPAFQRQLNNELRDRLKEIDAIEAQIASVDMQLGNLGQDEDERSRSSLSLLVSRQWGNESIRNTANEDTELFPGDFLEVGVESVPFDKLASAAID